MKGSLPLSRLLKTGSSAFLVKILYAALSLITSIYLARELGAENYGVYAFALSVLTLIGIPSQLGLPQLVVRETARFDANGDASNLKGLWVWSILVVAAFSSFSAVVLFLFLKILGLDQSEQVKIIYLGLPLIPMIALGNIRGAAIRGLRHVVLGMLPESIVRPLTLILLLLCFNAIFGNAEAQHAIIIYVLASVIAFIFGVAVLWKVKPITRGLKAKFESKKWLRSALPLSAITGLEVLNHQADILMLGWFVNPEEIGQYKVALSISALIVFGSQALNMLMAPYFSRFYVQKDIDSLQSSATLSARLSFVFSICVAITVWMFGESLLEIFFGKEYLPAYWPLSLIALAQLVNSASGSVALLLNMSSNEKSTLYGVSLSAVLNIILNVILIPLYGINGAAVASSVTIVTWNIYLWFSVKKVMGVDASIFGHKRL